MSQPWNNDPFVPPPPPGPEGNPGFPPEVLIAKKKEASDDARNALILSLVGFVCLGLILGILAFKKANSAIETIDTYGVAKDKRGLATAAKIISVIDIIGWAIVLVGRIWMRT